MKGQDLGINYGTITVHPDKLNTMKEAALTEVTPDAIGRMRDTVIGEELEMFVEDLFHPEIADNMRAEVRAMLAKGLGL